MKPVLSTTVYGPGLDIAVFPTGRKPQQATPPNMPEDQAARLRSLMRSADLFRGGDQTPVAQEIARPNLSRPATPPIPVQVQPPAPIRVPRSINHAHVVAVASGKGGVGKTSISVNLAIALTNLGCRVTLVDGDLSLGNADVMCGVHPTGHLGHVVDGSRTIQQITLDAPGGFKLVPGASGVARLADLDAEGRAILLDSFAALDNGADIILLDCGAGIGSGVFSMLDLADLTLVVTTPEPTAITDAYALIKCAIGRQTKGDTDEVAPFALVVNQAQDWEEADEVHRRIVGVARRFLEFEMPMAGWVRHDRAMPESVRARRPVLLNRPGSSAAASIGTLSESVCGLLQMPQLRLRQNPGIAARFLRLFKGEQPAPTTPIRAQKTAS